MTSGALRHRREQVPQSRWGGPSSGTSDTEVGHGPLVGAGVTRLGQLGPGVQRTGEPTAWPVSRDPESRGQGGPSASRSRGRRAPAPWGGRQRVRRGALAADRRAAYAPLSPSSGTRGGPSGLLGHGWAPALETAFCMFFSGKKLQRMETVTCPELFVRSADRDTSAPEGTVASVSAWHQPGSLG